MITKPIRKHMETQFRGIPKVLFCKKCVMSNQRPRINLIKMVFVDLASTQKEKSLKLLTTIKGTKCF